MNFKNPYSFINIFLYSILLFVVLNLTVGTYFIGNERLFNAYLLHEFTAPLHFDNNYNAWFLTAPFISFLNRHFIYSFNLCYSIVIILNLTVITYNTAIFLKIDVQKYQIALLSLLFLFFFSIVINISNRTLIIFTVFNTLFTIYNYIKASEHQKKLRFLLVILIIVNIILRFEIAIIIFAIGLFSGILFRQRKFNYLCSICLAVTFFAFIIFHVMQVTVYKEFNYVEKAEHEFYDRNTKYFDEETNKKEQLKKMALSYFVVDQDHFDNSYYEGIFKSSSLIKNKMNRVYFNHIVSKNKVFYTELFTNKMFLFYLTILLISLFALKDKGIRNKLGIIILFVLAVPACFNLFLDFKTDLSITIYLFILFATLLYILKDKNRINIFRFRLIKLLIAILILFNAYSVITKKHHYNQHEKRMISYYRNILKYGKASNKPVVFAGLVPNFESYPSKLFSIKRDDLVPHYYLNLFFYAQFPYYTTHNEKFFTNIGSFKNRVIDVIENDAIFVSNEELNQFILEYSEVVCGLNIRIEKLEIGRDSSINPIFEVYKIKFNT